MPHLCLRAGLCTACPSAPLGSGLGADGREMLPGPSGSSTETTH